MSKGHTLVSRIFGRRASAGRSVSLSGPHSLPVSRYFRGDTLIEVAIAIAIFSLVAIGVVSVVNGSTSAAQNALEVTVTREEIDAQAEALRYIHNSYIAGSRSNSADNEKYRSLWNTIKAHGEHNDATLEAILNYNPSTCAELYDDRNEFNIFRQNAFIINTHYLGDPIDYTDHDTYTDTDRRYYEAHTIQSAAADATGSPVANALGNNMFTTASTFPRVLFNSTVIGDATLGDTSDSLLDQAGNNVAISTDYFSDEVYAAEGLYVIAVKDQNTTAIINAAGSSTVSYESAFYDFYIRSCWFAPGAERPSTISTVIRLQDPETIDYDSPDIPRIDVTFHRNDGTGGSRTSSVATTATEVAAPTWTRTGYTLLGWSIYEDASTPTYTGGYVPAVADAHYYAVWAEDLPEPTPEPAPTPIPETFDLEINLSWTASRDLDAYFEIPGAGTVYWNRPQIVSGDTTVSLSGDNYGRDGSAYSETITATNLHRDQTYYFYVKNGLSTSASTNVFSGSGATVTVTSPAISGATFNAATDSTGAGVIWQVFKIERGEIIPLGTVTNAARF